MKRTGKKTLPHWLGAREILQTKRQKRNNNPFFRRQSSHRRLGRAAFAGMLIVAASAAPAFAVDEPRMVSSVPRVNGPVRSDVANPITATFDRDLNEQYSTFDVFTASNAPVSGHTFLAGARSDTGGFRTIAFRPGTPMTEVGNPYTIKLHAVPFVPTTSTDMTYHFTIDDTPPSAPSITDPSNGQARTDQPVVLRGVAEPGALVTAIEGQSELATDQATDTGAFAVFLPYPPEDGVWHTVATFATDEAGNIGATSAGVTFYHDSVSQQPVILTPAEGATLNTASVNVGGTAKPGTSVTIEEAGSTIGTTGADPNGNWATALTFGEGSHTITASAFDGVFTDGPSLARHFTVDLTAPAAPVIDTPAAGAQLNTSIVTISGTAEPHTGVRVREGTLLRATAAADTAGAWSVSLSFTEGAHTISAAAVDAAGNIGPAATRTFSVDTVPPATPMITSPAEAAFVNVDPVTVTGAAEAGATVNVLEGTVTIGTTTASGSGAWSVAISFSEAAHSIGAIAIDAAGNVSGRSATRSFTVDTIAPAAPVITTPAQSATVTTASVNVGGTAEGSTTVTIKEGTSTLATTVTSPNGTWSVSIAFANGAHTITATATDNAGNASAPSAARSFTVAASGDTTPPAAPAIVTPALGSIQPGTVLFTGTAEAASTVRVLEGMLERGSATADPNGNWRLAITMLSGPHTVTATATDRAGNVGAASPPVSFTVDDRPPTIEFTTPSGTIFLPGAPATLDGDASDNLGVTTIVVDYFSPTGEKVLTAPASCAGCPGTTTTWQAGPSLPPGVYTAQAFAVDLAGNRSQPATIRFYRL